MDGKPDSGCNVVHVLLDMLDTLMSKIRNRRGYVRAGSGEKRRCSSRGVRQHGQYVLHELHSAMHAQGR